MINLNLTETSRGRPPPHVEAERSVEFAYASAAPRAKLYLSKVAYF
jgi:hypothetical protein